MYVKVDVIYLPVSAIDLRGYGGWGSWCLTPLSTIFQLYRGGQFYWENPSVSRT
jgi:hypothetical protein